MNRPAHTSHPAAVEPVEYIVVVSSDDDYHAGYHQFAEKVNRKLKAGYHLYGPPVPIKQALCQAMVRYEKNTPATITAGSETSMVFKAL